MPETTKEIALRTLASDTAAIARSATPAPMNIAVHIDETAAPTNVAGEAPAPKKHGAALTIVVVIFALAALGGAGYLLYKNLTSPVTG